MWIQCLCLTQFKHGFNGIFPPGLEFPPVWSLYDYEKVQPAGGAVADVAT